MRLACLVVLAACASAKPPAPSNTASRTPAPASPIREATLIVRGHATIYDGIAVGGIAVTRVLKGAADSTIHFEPQPGPLPDHEAIFYLVRSEMTPTRWRMLQPGPSSWGSDTTMEPSIIAEVAANVTPAVIPGELDADLATFRAAHGQPWTPAQRPAVDAALRVFAQIAWIGMTAATVEQALGKPDKVEGDLWHYTRHVGEFGVIRVLRFEQSRVTAVDIHLTD